MNLPEQTAFQVTVDPCGCISVPAELLERLGLVPGDRLMARAEDGTLVMEKPEAIQERLYALFAHIPKDVSLADELIAEHRAEAAREEAEMLEEEAKAPRRQQG